MMPSAYIALNGQEDTFDLDSVIDVARGSSSKRKGWTALIVYQAGSGKFIELRDSPQDLQGNSQEEAEEVAGDYIEREFGIDSQTLQGIIKNPEGWIFIDHTL